MTIKEKWREKIKTYDKDGDKIDVTDWDYVSGYNSKREEIINILKRR